MSKAFKIGIWIENDNLPENGGGFSYAQRLVKEIDLKQFDKELEIVFVGHNLNSNFLKNKININIKENFYKRKITNLFHKFLGINIYKKKKNLEEESIEILKTHNVQLLFFTTPYIKIRNFPFIVTNWDLGHKTTYAFPELSMNGQFNQRDEYFKNTLGEALLICSESQEGKEEIIRNFHTFPDKIKILPMFAGSIIDQNIISSEPVWATKIKSFFIYPAQFWPHKNHYNLIIAFKHFLEDRPGESHFLILSGSDKGNLPYIHSLIKELNMEEYIITPGFISIQELKWLYENTNGLIFPSFLGPTNMPLLEALSLGCKIACSNLKGHKELLKDNAFYFDPKDHAEIKNAFINLLNQDVAIHVVSRQTLDPELDILEQIFLDAIPIRKVWGI